MEFRQLIATYDQLRHLVQQYQALDKDINKQLSTTVSGKKFKKRRFAHGRLVIGSGIALGVALWYMSKSATEKATEGGILEDAAKETGTDSPFGLSWTGNSCYLDSVLICLLLNENPIITKEILEKEITQDTKCTDDPVTNKEIKRKIQAALRDLAASFRGKRHINNCTDFRALLRSCPAEQKFHLTGTQDADEFLKYLLRIFPLSVATQQKTSWKKNGNHWDLSHNYSMPVDAVVVAELEVLDPDRDLTQCLKVQNQFTHTEKVKTEIEHTEYKTEIVIYSPLLIFSANRLQEDNTINFTLVTAPEKFLNNGKLLNLIGIVVYRSMHYTAYVTYKGVWWYYNDLGHSWTRIGTYEAMIKSDPNPFTNGTLFFYY